MSLYSAMYTSVTGLTTSSQDLGVVSDNIANANTIGFKGSRASFQDILGMNYGPRGQGGLGARLQAIQKILTQGALTSTGLATDLALQGPGFFMVEAPDGTAAYTRAGQFTVDEQGDLVNLEGLKVQGYGADPITGTVNGTVGSLQVGNASAPPNATTTVQATANLNSNATDQTVSPWDINDPNSYDHAISTVIYDSLGNPIEAQVQFEQTGPSTWRFHIVTDGGNLNGGTPGVLTEIGQDTLTFDPADGSFVSQGATTFSIDVATGGLAPQDVDFDFSTMTSAAAQKSSTSFISQDGYQQGELANIQIDNEGNIVGAFTNGESRTLGQVAIADFAGADKLERLGGNMFRETRDSGPPVVGAAGTGGRGTLVAGALELSNVDLAGEFVRMIVAQRGFQANGKAITTADTLLGELMQLKR